MQVNIHILGGGFKYFLFSPLLWEMIQFDDHIFQMGWNHQLVSHEIRFPINQPVFHGMSTWFSSRWSFGITSQTKHFSKFQFLLWCSTTAANKIITGVILFFWHFLGFVFVKGDLFTFYHAKSPWSQPPWICFLGDFCNGFYHGKSLWSQPPLKGEYVLVHFFQFTSFPSS